jgi:hypothetical protein
MMMIIMMMMMMMMTTMMMRIMVVVVMRMIVTGLKVLVPRWQTARPTRRGQGHAASWAGGMESSTTSTGD